MSPCAPAGWDWCCPSHGSWLGKVSFSTSHWPEEYPCAHRTPDKHEDRTRHKRRDHRGCSVPPRGPCTPGTHVVSQLRLLLPGWRCPSGGLGDSAPWAPRCPGMGGDLWERAGGCPVTLNKAAVTSTLLQPVLPALQSCGSADLLLCGLARPAEPFPGPIPGPLFSRAFPWPIPRPFPGPIPGPFFSTPFLFPEL